MSDYKVLIASAGTGSRLNDHTAHRNKGLITLGTKPALAHIIEKFSTDIKIVIAVGYQKCSLMQIIREFFPDRSIDFVNVDKFEGPGSGLGHSILQCENLLQCPFVFIPNDTLAPNTKIDLNPRVHGNWLGVFDNKLDVVDTTHYRCLEVYDGNVLNILPKGLITDDVYVGLCGVKDYKQFWTTMKKSVDAVEAGESYGLNGLSNKKSIYINDWYDTGNLSRLEDAVEHYKSTQHNILPKADEAIWITDHKCVKYHKDPKFINDRLNRMQFLPKDCIPKILSKDTNYFSYPFIKGDLLSKKMDVEMFTSFLNTMQRHMWSNKRNDIPRAKEILHHFYTAKTHDRINSYFERYEQKDNIRKINGQNVDAVSVLLSNFDWEKFFHGTIWSHFHGDLHGENIVVSDDGEFYLLDWRQNFGADNYEYGDVYYDLGKILHGLLVRHTMVSQDRYFINHFAEHEVELDIDSSLAFSQLVNVFERWIQDHGYDLTRVRQVTSLIFLNIAALHHFPYSKFLFCLGQLLLDGEKNHE